MKRYFHIFLLLNICFLSAIFGENRDNSSAKRYYITPEQIVIDEQGMHALLKDELVPIQSLFHDEHGYSISTEDLILYGVGDRYTCPNGHPAPMGRGRCNNPSCPHFGR